MSKVEPMFNVDRWFYYSKQKLNLGTWGMMLFTQPWPRVTYAQGRRMRKKMRKNSDKSLGWY